MPMLFRPDTRDEEDRGEGQVKHTPYSASLRGVFTLH